MSIPHGSSLAFVALLALSGSASAQEPGWMVDLYAGAALPTATVQGEDLGAGFGFGGTLAYRFMPHLAAYGGWEWHGFAPEESFAGDDVDFEETGYTFGLRFEHPFGSGDGVAYRLRAGGTVTHVEMEDVDGELLADSGHGIGWEAGAGVSIPVSEGWRVVPEARFRSSSRDVEVEGDEVEVALRYVALGLSFSHSF